MQRATVKRSEDAAITKALRAARACFLGKNKKQRKETLAYLREHKQTLGGIVGFCVATKVTGKRDTRRRAIRVIVRKKKLPEALAAAGVESVPMMFAGFLTDVVEAPAAQPIVMGSEAKHTFSSEFGTTAIVITRDGAPHAVSCSHVLAPAAMSPAVGDECLFDGVPYTNSLAAWTTLTDGGTTSADVAIARVAGPITTQWPDGAAFTGPDDYDRTDGPFTIFGRLGTVVAATGTTLRSVRVDLDIGRVTYEGQFFLDAPVELGDSGAPVRSASGALVGMVVAAASNGAWCTPWPAVVDEINAITI